MFLQFFERVEGSLLLFEDLVILSFDFLKLLDIRRELRLLLDILSGLRRRRRRRYYYWGRYAGR